MSAINIVAKMASSGETVQAIEKAIGRELSGPEKVAWFHNKKKAPKTTLERVQKFRNKARQIELPAVEDMSRRKEKEQSPEEWLKYYMAAAYPFPFSTGHIDLMRNTVYAAKTGTGTATAQPRGEGKTTVLRGMSLYITVLQLVRFPVLVGWKHSDAHAAMKIWLHMLTNSKEFAADYPEFCTPFLYSTHKTALSNLIWHPDTPVIGGRKTGALVDGMDKIICLPNSLGAVAARSAQGDAKGLQVQLIDGTILRPDLLLFDDAQDPHQANNPAFITKTIDTIENIFMGMAGPQKRIVPAAACTVEAEDDVSCYWLNRKDFKTNIVSRVEVWPDGKTGGTWEADKDCPIRLLWREWWDMHLSQKPKEAKGFFRSHRKTMTGKMKTSWKHRFDPDKDVCDIDAAMYDWHKLGESVFSRAQQNKPLERRSELYKISPLIIKSRTAGRRVNELPEWSEFVCASTDLNPSYGFTWSIVGFGKDQSAVIGNYGIYDRAPIPISGNDSESQKHRAIYKALTDLGKQIADNPMKPTHWIIDAGGAQSKPVRRFAMHAQQLIGIPVICAYGRGGKAARMTSKHKRRMGEEWMECRDRRENWLIWNADYWREIAQRSFACNTGAPGGSTLPVNIDNSEFAQQMCSKKLLAKGLVGDRMIWNWSEPSGKDDYNDVLNMAFVAASFVANVGTGGFLEDTKPKRKRYSQKDLRR